MFSKEKYYKLLNTKILGADIYYKPITSSTNDDAWDLVEKNEFQEGTVVIANAQKKGRGRLKKSWVTTPGDHLAFSVILVPDLPFEKMGLISLLASVSAAEGLHKISGIDFKLKWPNDILVCKNKIGGILIETKIINNILIAVVGIGINVNESISDFPDHIKDMASSLKIMIGENFSKESVLASILEKIELNYDNIDNICVKWNDLCAHLNQSTQFHLVNKTITGDFIGITPMGHARMRINNKEQTYSTGELSI